MMRSRPYPARRSREVEAVGGRRDYPFSPLFLLCSVIILNEVCRVFGFGQNGVMSITPQEKQLNDAIAIAADVHRNQVRKEPDGRPYICHVLDVVNGLPNDLPPRIRTSKTFTSNA